MSLYSIEFMPAIDREGSLEFNSARQLNVCTIVHVQLRDPTII